MAGVGQLSPRTHVDADLMKVVGGGGGPVWHMESGP